jgi:hypothetical protein
VSLRAENQKAGKWKLATDNWELEAGDWQLAADA